LPKTIVKSKIIPPNPPKNILHRSRLNNLLKKNLNKKIILFTASAGYGKTTAVVDFLSACNLTFCWINSHSLIENLYIFLHYLIESFRTLNSSFGYELEKIVEGLEKDARKIDDEDNFINETCILISNEIIDKFSGEIYLVMDNVHEISQHSWLGLFLEKLLSYQPDNFHLVITTRTHLNIQTGRLKATRELFEITNDELAFTGNELNEIISTQYRLTYNESYLKYLENYLKGWITGIHLILQTIGTEDPKKVLWDASISRDIFDYFANEIFLKLDKEIQNFLLVTSPLESFDSEMSSFLTDNESKQILDMLVKNNAFIESKKISQDGSDRELYSYQELFRDFINKKAEEIFSAIERKKLLLKISSFFLNKDEPANALNYLLDAKDFEESEKIFVKLYDKNFNDGNFELLWKLISKFDPVYLSNSAYLLNFKGILTKFIEGNLKKAMEHIDSSLELQKKDPNKELFIICMINKTELLINLGNYDEAQEILNKIISDAKSPYDKAKILYFFSLVFFAKSELEETLKFLNGSLDICTENNFDDLKLDIYNYLGNIYLIKGEYISSQFFYKQITDKSTSISKKFLALGNLALLCSRTGKFDDANEYYTKSKKLLRFFTTPIFDNAVDQIEFSINIESGSYLRADELAKSINQMALKLNNKQQIYLSYIFLGESSMFLENYLAAKEYLNLARNFLDTSSEYETVNYDYINSILDIKQGLLNEETEQHLTKACALFNSSGFSYDKAISCYYLALYYSITKQKDLTKKYLEESLRLSKENAYISFLQREFEKSKYLYDISVSENIYKDFTKNLINEKIAYYEKLWIEDKSEIRNKIYDIELCAMGIMKFKVRGELISESKWVRKKGKLILAYILLNKDFNVTKDKIVDLFFQDVAEDRSDNLFHQAISSIRNVIKTGEYPAPFLLYENRILKLNPDYKYYADSTEFNNLYNLIMSPGTNENDKIKFSIKAIELYNGPLLEEFYDSWCEDLREEYSGKFIKLSEILLKNLYYSKEFHEIIPYAQKLLKFDKLNENAYLLIIESYVKTENISKAKECFADMLKNYELELMEKPPKSVLDRIQALLS
jgi:ATP/maltotriose-dependent transcriptional regulator MalT